MKAFVTGGTGFVGSHLVHHLLDRGDEVTCLARNPAKLARVFPNRAPAGIPGDLSDVAALERGCGHADTVFHVAGLTAARNRAEFFETNVVGTRRLTRAIAKASRNIQRLIYVSSQAAAGPVKYGEVRSENDAPDPVSNYGASKLAGEEVVRASGLPWTIVRPPSVYGPRDVQFLRLFKIARTGIVPVFGSPHQQLSIVHVSDLVTGMTSAMGGATEGKTYFICHPEIVTSGALARAVYGALKGKHRRKKGPVVVPIPAFVTRAALWATGIASTLARRPSVLAPDKANEFLAEAWTCSPAALERDTGWRAKISMEPGLDQTARWYKTEGWL
ncbi:MAG: NAD-dependent epimerase/dehydratase family protein [Gemmatimonadales bacterium]